jgi:hypothetical protein
MSIKNRLLTELRKQQEEAVEGLDDDLIIERIKRIQYLVYNFIYMIIRKLYLSQAIWSKWAKWTIMTKNSLMF